MKRIKKKLHVITSRHEAEAVVGEIANATLNKIGLTAKMDQEVAAAKARYLPLLQECDDFITEKTDDLYVWSDANEAEFGKAKSIKFAVGTVGFRTGTPKLSLLNRSWNWEKVLDAVGVVLPNFIRQKPEIDKEAILDQREELAVFLPSVGLKVNQDESFYVEPHITDVEIRQVTEVAK
jgi:phage host-nuclease inhibitor protein Gam